MAKAAKVTTELEENQKLHIENVDPSKNQPIPPFIGIGREGTTRHGIEGIDSARVFSTLSGRSAWFFWRLVAARNFETNLCKLSELHLTKTEKGRVPRAYQELKSRSLVVRHAKGSYLINPKIVLPKFDRFEALWDKWETTCNKRRTPVGD